MAKKIIAIILAMCLGMSMGLQAFAEELNEAKIGETEYETFAGAVSAANGMAEEKDEEGNVISIVIELLKDIVLGEKVVIDRDITIDGGEAHYNEENEWVDGYTIERTEDYNGTIFEVKNGGVLTLDGDVVIDGGNEWTSNDEQYFEDMDACISEKASTDNPRSYNESEEGGNKSTAPLIKVNNGGEVIVEDATIQNNFADRTPGDAANNVKEQNYHNTGAVFSVAEGAEVVINEGATIQHIRSSVFGQVSGEVTMNGGVIKDVFGENCNGGVIDLRNSGSMTINGGEITQVRVLGLNANGNGIVAQVFGTEATLTMNGGYIHDNASFSPGSGWGSVIYLNRGGQFIMTDGTIADTKSDICTAFVSNREDGKAELLGGTIVIDSNTGKGGIESFFCGDITIGKEMEIIGKEGAIFAMYGEKGNILDIDGEVKGDGIMWLMTTEPITGEGNISSDVLVKYDKNYGMDYIIIEGGNWTGDFLVDSVGTDAKLTILPGANVSDGEIRVLESVADGDYTNAENSAKAQASAYDATGANVTSNVRFYHRLTSAQKSNIVVTFDYNGGVDENGWSGCQVTGEEAFVPESPIPAKDGYVFAGWDYAVVNDPETLDMTGLEAYENEAIGQTLRLVAKWTVVEDDPIIEEEEEEEEEENEPTVIVDEPTPLDDAPSAPEEQYDVPETETIVDEEVPLADVPGLGDESAIWMLVAAFAVFGLVVINLPKRNREED